MNASPKHIRLWLLLCSDLAIRSGTAARINPANYDPNTKTLRFTTKMGEKLTLPCTAEISELLSECSMQSETPFVRQLQQKQSAKIGRPLELKPQHTIQYDKDFRKIMREVGITRRITPHDLRRTTAVAMYKHTGDIRDVQALLGHRTMQSTVWYLDHDLVPVKRATLELIKRPEWRKARTA